MIWLPTANGCAVAVTAVVTLFVREKVLTLTKSLCGFVSCRLDAAGTVLELKFAHVSSPSVSRIVTYGRHWVAQQQFAPTHQPPLSQVVRFGLQVSQQQFEPVQVTAELHVAWSLLQFAGAGIVLATWRKTAFCGSRLIGSKPARVESHSVVLFVACSPCQ